jgi:SulP family sulfate permease
MSFLNYKVGGRYRIINFIAAAIIAIILLKGSFLLNYIPRFLAPGVLMFIGIDFLIDWLYKPAQTLSRRDYGIVVLIFITIIATQLAYGIILGIAISLLKFAWEYSRVNPIDGIYYGQTLTSHVVRGYDESHLLDEHGSEICLVRLHGNLFFGNVYRVFLQMQKILNQKKKTHYLIFDFSAVDGVDSSCRNAIYSFLYKAKQKEVEILTVGLFDNAALNAEKELQGSGLDPASDFAEVNDALEWCEQALLVKYKGADYHNHIDIKELQVELALSDEQFALFISFWDGPKVFSPGDMIIHQKDKNKDIYFLTKGIVGVKVHGTKRRIGVANIHTGSIFGEVAYYTGQARMSDVQSITESEVYCLPLEQLQYMEDKYPKLALRLHRYIARQMTEKIKYFNSMLQAMLHHH